jgi:isocitrate dehydrogenase
MTDHKIYWTETDEAPYLATFSFYPIIKGFTKGTGVDVVLSDISLAGRILANFPDFLTEAQRIPDNLAMLGELALTPEANIIKLPNISASIPQLQEAIAELQSQGYKLPDYPENPKTDAEKEIQTRYAKVLGSAVNPVLRQGNSDRRAPVSVKKYAQKHPKKLPLKPWSPDSKTHVAHMTEGDFYGNEKSVTMDNGGDVRIEFQGGDESVKVLKDKLPILPGEVMSGTFMSRKALRAFYAAQIEDAKAQGLLLSLHLKATMMKVSDPILFGHAVSVYYEKALTKHAAVLKEVGFNPNNGIGDLYAKIKSLPEAKRAEIEADIQAVYAERPALAMVDSDHGITNLHVPSDIIVDASMPVVVRESGQMWGPDGNLHETKAMIPDRCYSRVYKAMIEDCKKHGAYDRATMGGVPNVGLMAQQAEEYGSHPTTYEIPADGTIRVVAADGRMLMEHKVEIGDVWRLSRVKDIPIRDWVKLAVKRARATGAHAVFWLDKNRAHDAQLIAKVERYLKDHDTGGLTIKIMPPVDAVNYSLERTRKGQDTISVTGNVLRDYLTDLFPILEIGTSAYMLSIVPLLAGGGLFETGAGGSAPKHVQQFEKANYLRWDSLGEFSAFAASLEHLSAAFNNEKAKILAETLDAAIGKFLDNEKSPARKVGQIDIRGSHFYLALYWAEFLAAQDTDPELKARFTAVAKALGENADKIDADLIAVQGGPVDMGGYYHPDKKKVDAAMRPNPILNAIIDAL